MVLRVPSQRNSNWRFFSSKSQGWHAFQQGARRAAHENRGSLCRNARPPLPRGQASTVTGTDLWRAKLACKTALPKLQNFNATGERHFETAAQLPSTVCFGIAKSRF